MRNKTIITKKKQKQRQQRQQNITSKLSSKIKSRTIKNRNTKPHTQYNINLDKRKLTHTGHTGHIGHRLAILKHNFYIGCHISITPSILSGLEYLTHIKGNAAQIFLGSTKSSSLNAKHKFNDININNIKNYISYNNIYLSIHSIYLLNFCKANPHTHFGMVKYMHDNIQYDLKYGALIGAKCVILHLGFAVLLENSIAINNFINNIIKIIKNMPDNIKLALETTAGQGTQIGRTLEELALIWNGITSRIHKLNGTGTGIGTGNKHKLQVGICIDTAHIFASGYNISTLDGIKFYLDEFNKLIGWQHIIMFHINDNKFKCNSKKDVHKGIGQGEIFNTQEGIDVLKYIKTFCIKHNIPMILETHKTNSNKIITYEEKPSIKNNIKNNIIDTNIIDTNINTGYEWEIDYIKNI